MVALLNDLAVGQKDDIVRMLNGAQSVGNDQHRTDIFHLLQRILDQQLRFRVDICGGLVQDHHAGLVDDGAGKGQQLPLTGGEIVAPFPDHIVQTLLQLVDKAIGIDIAAGLHNLFVGNAFLTQQNIAADIAGKQEYILQHLTEMPAQRGYLDLADINAVDQDLTLLNVVIAADQAENGGLAGAGRAHESHRLLGLHMERNALEHPFAGLIGKPDILKLDLASDGLKLDGIRIIHHLRNHIHNGEYLFSRGKRGLQHIKML